MPSAYLVLQAQKSQAYIDSLCKHFARKVEVVREDDSATVMFPMGQCKMSVSDRAMYFEAHADNEEALNTVKYIVDSHAVRFGELKEATVEWRAEPMDLATSGSL